MRAWMAIGLFALCACARKEAPRQAPSIATEQGRDELLAFSPPGGDAAIDRKIVKLQELVKKRSDRVEAWLELGNAWIQKARDTATPRLYANAGACAGRALALDPGNRLAIELRGLVLMNDHRFEEARALMQGVVERAPTQPVAWGTLSDALLELGRTQEAIDAAQRMVDLKPNLPSYSRAAHLQWLRGDLAGARESLRAAIDAGGASMDREPQSWVLVQAAMVFWNEGDAEGAEAGFDRALAQLPDFPPALVGKGRVALGRGEGRAAVGYLEKAYRANPLVETGWLLGDARQLAGDATGAEQVWSEIDRRGRATDPRTLALFLATKDRAHDDAVRLALEERRTRDDQYTEDTIAWALYRAGRLDEALAAASKATALGTRDARLWFHEGAIRLAKGDAARGRELLQKALHLNPHFDRTGEEEARALLDPRVAARGARAQ